MNSAELATVTTDLDPSYELDDPYAAVDEYGQPEDQDYGDAFSGGGSGDTSEPTGDSTDGSCGYGGEFGTDGVADGATSWGGGQVGEGEAGRPIQRRGRRLRRRRRLRRLLGR